MNNLTKTPCASSLACLFLLFMCSCSNPDKDDIKAAIVRYIHANGADTAKLIYTTYSSVFSACERAEIEYMLATQSNIHTFPASRIKSITACSIADSNYPKVLANSYALERQRQDIGVVKANDSAKKYSYQCIKELAEDERCYELLAEAYYSDRNYDSCRITSMSGSIAWPLNIRLHNRLGESLFELGRNTQSIAAIASSINICGSHNIALHALDSVECAIACMQQSTNYANLDQVDSMLFYSRGAYIYSGRSIEQLPVLATGFMLLGNIDSMCYYGKLAVLRETDLDWEIINTCAQKAGINPKSYPQDELLLRWLRDSSVTISSADLIAMYTRGNNPAGPSF